MVSLDKQENIIWAKSDPPESLQDHTNGLLENLDILKEMHPAAEAVDWELLEQACIYHDLGKIHPYFQEKITTGRKKNVEVPHSYLSTAFIDTKSLKETYNKDRLKILVNAVAYHHNRADYNQETVKNSIEALRKASEGYMFHNAMFRPFKAVSIRYLNSDRLCETDSCFWDYILIKGLLNRLDYAASAHTPVEIKNDFLESGLHSFFLNEGYEWNALQRYLYEHQKDNVVVVAETGMGKTEGALLWIGNQKGFFTLPIRTAINAIYKRIKKDIVPENRQNVLGILHSGAKAVMLEDHTLDTVEAQYNLTKQLALPLTVSTVDQLFKFVFRHLNFEAQLATLSYSKIVIDEIQMYEASLLAYLIYGLKLITKLGGKFAILTATFPSFLYDFMSSEKIPFQKPSQPFIKSTNRHNIKVIEADVDTKCILDNSAGKKTLVICNTVKKARQVYDSLVALNTDIEIKMLHSKYIAMDRRTKELEIEKDSESSQPVIWVTTQIVEASLDIDFDVLHTELSELSGLFQRFGRCNRKGKKDISDTNCYVYLGGQGKTSGVGTVIDETIFEVSKSTLIGFEGIMSEKNKMDMIETAYSYESIRKSGYYQTFYDNYQRLENLLSNTKTKREVDKIFRNIDSVSVIPLPVYMKYKEEIESFVEAYHLKGINGEATRRKRLEIMMKMRAYQVSLRPYEIDQRKEFDLIFKGSYDKIIPVINCEYDFEKGVSFIADKSVGSFW